MRRLVIIFALFFASLQPGLFAQSSNTTFLYENETSLGLLAHTRGWGISTQFTKHRTVNNYRLWDFNLYSLKHPKEVRLPNKEALSSRSFVYGKMNSLYVLKANYGARRILSDKLSKNSVRINLNYSVGPVLGILKPVYYDVKLPTADNGKTVEKQQRFDPENTDMQQYTVGTANFLYAIGESKFTFGANAKTSLSFEWGRNDDKFYSLETGLMVDAFPKEVPIFAVIENDKVFINLFLTFSYGSRR